MRVNSASIGFLTHRLVLRAGIAIVMILGVSEVFALGGDARFVISRSPGTETALGHKTETPPGHGRDRDLLTKQVNILIRLIGHQLLLQAGDSTSQVLPVTEVKEGTFLLQLEKQFIFSHDSLIALSQNYFPKTRFPSGYTVTVHDCLTAGIVYGFQINSMSPDLIACRGRTQAEGCYVIEFTFPDFYTKAEPDKAERHTSIEKSKSSNPDRPEGNTKSGASTTTSNAEMNLLADVRASSEADAVKSNTKPEELKAATSGYPLINLVYSGMLVSLGVTLLIARFKEKLLPTQDENRTILKEPVQEFPALGKFRFDVKGQRLLLANEVISLTEKECRILELLNESFGELIPRETLMQKIWIDEGVITGRSLDMFVSKLRKKLSGDSQLSITNVHAKGYKLTSTGFPTEPFR